MPKSNDAKNAPAATNDAAAQPAAEQANADQAATDQTAADAQAKPAVTVLAEKRRGNLITRVLTDLKRVWKEVEEVVEGGNKGASK